MLLKTWKKFGKPGKNLEKTSGNPVSIFSLELERSELPFNFEFESFFFKVENIETINFGIWHFGQKS